MPTRLNDRLVKRLTAERSDRDVMVADTEAPGLAITCHKGSPFYYVYRWTTNGKTRKVSLGPTATTTLEEARAKAQEMRRLKRQGGDPARALERLRHEVDVDYLMKRFLEDYSALRNKPGTVKNNRNYVAKWVTPLIGQRTLTTIRRVDAIEIRARLAREGGHTVENAVIAILRKAFNLAEDWELRPINSNPFLRLGMRPCGSRSRKLDTEEIGRLGDALEEFRPAHRAVVALIELLIFTGCRKNEIALARFDQFDAERRVLVLPDSKTGQRVVTLSDAAIAVIKSIDRSDGSPWLIPGPIAGEPVRSPYNCWRRILARAKLKNVRIHDLRHLFGTYSHHYGASQRTVATLLGHRQLSTTERYIDGMDDVTRLAANRTAGGLKGLLTKKPELV